MNTRRTFIAKIAAIAAAPAFLCSKSFAQAPPVKLEESDPTATALGYKEDSSKVDGSRYPQYKAGQKCEGCVLYQGKAGEANGPCGAFGGKLVLSGGWCAVFAAKPKAP